MKTLLVISILLINLFANDIGVNSASDLMDQKKINKNKKIIKTVFDIKNDNNLKEFFFQIKTEKVNNKEVNKIISISESKIDIFENIVMYIDLKNIKFNKFLEYTKFDTTYKNKEPIVCKSDTTQVKRCNSIFYSFDVENSITENTKDLILSLGTSVFKDGFSKAKKFQSLEFAEYIIDNKEIIKSLLFDVINKNTINNLKKDKLSLASLDEKFLNLKSEKQQLESTIATLNAKQIELENKNRVLIDIEITKVKKNNKILIKSSNKLKKENSLLLSKLNKINYKEKVIGEDLRNENKSLIIKINDIKKEYAKLIIINDNFKNEALINKKDIAGNEKNLEVKVKLLEKEKDLLIVENKKLKKTNNSNQNALGNTKEIENDRKILNMKISQLEEEKNVLINSISTLKENKNKTESRDTSFVKEENIKLKKESLYLKDKISELKTKDSSYNSKILDLTKNNSNLTEQNNLLNKEITILKNKANKQLADSLSAIKSISLN